jgi:hypothetical protein
LNGVSGRMRWAEAGHDTAEPVSPNGLNAFLTGQGAGKCDLAPDTPASVPFSDYMPSRLPTATEFHAVDGVTVFETCSSGKRATALGRDSKEARSLTVLAFTQLRTPADGVAASTLLTLAPVLTPLTNPLRAAAFRLSRPADFVARAGSWFR